MLTLPNLKAITWEWWLYLIAGALISFRVREVVSLADPSRPLIGLDYGLLLGSLAYYLIKVYKRDSDSY